MFENDVTKLVKTSSKTIFSQMTKKSIFAAYPDEFKILLNRKFAFRIQIAKYNIERKYYSFTIYKLTENHNIIEAQLKRSRLFQETKSAAETPTSIQDVSQEYSGSKDLRNYSKTTNL